MGLFGNGHGARIAELERQVATLTARVVKAESTAAEVAERAYRYMKKAESRARRELDESGAGATTTREVAGSPATPSSSQRVWGARGRRQLAMMRRARRDPLDEGEPAGEGVNVDAIGG